MKDAFRRKWLPVFGLFPGLFIIGYFPVTETKLFPSDKCSGYFGSRRFDRKGTEKIHMVSVSGLLETSHRIPSLDYDLLLKLTWLLTRSREEVWQMFSLMCFNVFAHNRDDHSNNFSFLLHMI